MTIRGTLVTESNMHHAAGVPSDREIAAHTLEEIRSSLRGLRFGSVNIIVQDGVVIQIDRTEKRRLRLNRADRES